MVRLVGAPMSRELLLDVENGEELGDVIFSERVRVRSRLELLEVVCDFWGERVVCR